VKTGSAGPSSLRTRPGVLTPVVSRERRRGTCGHVLSCYNQGPLCYACEAKAEDAAYEKSLARAIEIANRSPGKPGRRWEGIGKVDGVKLVPASLPGRQNQGPRWDAVLDEFLAGAAKCVRIEAPAVKPQGVYGALKAALDRRGCKEVYTCVRQGHAYLVRVERK